MIAAMLAFCWCARIHINNSAALHGVLHAPCAIIRAMNTMTYKAYTARIAFDEDENIFFGRVIGTRDMIDFHADNVADLRNEFKVTIDDYLAYCAERGIEPDKPMSGNVMLRVAPEVHSAVAAAAARAGKSINQWATEVLTHAAI